MQRISSNYFFIHNIYAHFFDDTLNYFADYLYPRFHHQVVGTYDKAVEYINKKSQYNNENDMPNLPAIILNPSGEFQMADANSGGMQLWRYPNISDGIPDLKLRLYDPIYQDNNVVAYPIYTRIKGEIELIMLLNSFYEYCDLRMFLFQTFGGLNRPIFPSTFRTFLIIPDELLNFNYNNEVTNVNYNLDWESCGAYDTLVRTTNRNEIVVPVNITPSYTLTSLSDASMRYGGIDKLADWRLGAMLEYEIEMPWYVYLKSDYLVENINFNFSINESYMGHKNNILDSSSNEIEAFKKQFDWGMSDGECSQKNTEEEVEETVICEREEWKKSGFYCYTFTALDIQNLDTNGITDGFIIASKRDDDNRIFITSKYGELSYKIDYVLSDVNNTDSLLQFICQEDSNFWKENDVLEIYSFTRED